MRSSPIILQSNNKQRIYTIAKKKVVIGDKQYTLPPEVLEKIAKAMVPHTKRMYQLGSKYYYDNYEAIMEYLLRSIRRDLLRPGSRVYPGYHNIVPLRQTIREKLLTNTFNTTGVVNMKGDLFQKLFTRWGVKDDYSYREGFLDSLLEEIDAEIQANRR